MGFEEELAKLVDRSEQQAGTDTGEGEATELLDEELAGDSGTEGEGEGVADTDTPLEEGAATTTEEDPKPEKKTLEDRLQEVIELNKQQAEKIAAMERKFQEKAEKNTELDFIYLDQSKVDAHVAQMKDEAEELRAAGKITDAVRKERDLHKFLDVLDQNEERRLAHEKRRAAGGNQQAILQSLDDAAEFYREQNKIPKDVFGKMGETFTAMLEKNPILAREFQERAAVSPIATITWAHEMLKKAAADNSAERKKREAGKIFTPTSPGGKAAKADEASATREKAIKDGSQESWAEHIAALTKPKK